MSEISVDKQQLKKRKYEIEKFSRNLSSILRHNAIKENIPIESNGFVLISDLLKNNKFKNNSIDKFFNEVKNSDKKRFQLAYKTGEIIPDDFNIDDYVMDPSLYKIRAVQGHSMPCIETHELLSPITSPSDVPSCIHGTFERFLDSIKETGLNRMKRNHIHFTTSLPNEGEVISGMRKSCEVAIYIDIENAMNDGIKFYRANNGVILTEGDNGIIHNKYFKEIKYLKKFTKD